MNKKKAFTKGLSPDSGKLPPILYGLSGIQRLFCVSKPTASRYKNTILKEAISQKGNVIVIDTAKALSLFGVEQAGNMVEGEVVENI